jgi:ADP-ribosyl-[dinitrogen reductase] hydrolase
MNENTNRYYGALLGLAAGHALGTTLEFRSRSELAGSVDPRTAGNGSLMRLAPVPLAYRENLERALHHAGESSRTTHGAPAARSMRANSIRR